MPDQRPTTWPTALSRRSALGTAAAFAAGLVGMHAVEAEESTSFEQESIELDEKVFTMFVQTARGGSLRPKRGEDGAYHIVLQGAAVQTIYFSDRPHRLVGTIRTEDFLHILGFSPENPPNAAIVAQTEEGEKVLVVELLNPVWDDATHSLTYDLIVLDEYTGDSFGDIVQRKAESMVPETFGHTSLFIDDCPERIVTTCHNDIPLFNGPIPGSPAHIRRHLVSNGPLIGEDGSPFFTCEDVAGDRRSLAELCFKTYPEQCPDMVLWYSCDPR